MSLVTTTSPHSVSATIDRLLGALGTRGIQVFARADHAAGAQAAGLELPDEEVVIFGDPRVGTLLMQSDPQIGYELPLRVLVWDAQGQTMVGYRLPTELSLEYDVSERITVLERMAQLLAQLVAESVADG
jgi:beta-galactosidase